MRLRLAIQITAVCLLAIATAVVAQQPGQQGQQGGRGRGGMGGPPGGFGGGFISRMFLLSSPEGRKELELADEQVAELEKVAAELREKYPMGGGRGGGGPPGAGGQRGNRPPGNNNNEGAMSVPVQWYFVQAQQPGQQGQGRGRGAPQTPE